VTRTPARTRLSPRARRRQLLDTAMVMLRQSGMTGFTMEALAQRAKVSAPLVYRYFPSRRDLLLALLANEGGAHGARVGGELEQASTLEEILRVCVAANFDFHSPGMVLPLLMRQPELAEVVRAGEKQARARIAAFLIERLAESFPIDRKQAELLLAMASGASIAAASHAAGSDRDATLDAAVRFILAGMTSLAGDRAREAGRRRAAGPGSLACPAPPRRR
jgi:AcrR family transcriptional regulator